MMTFWEHLDELRSTIIRVLVVVVLVAMVAFFLKEPLFQVVLAPRSSDFATYRLLGVEPFSLHLMNTGLTEQFMIHIKTALYAGLLVASPYVLYELFHFVSPALYSNERRYALWLVGSIGEFFAKFVKCAVSREREFLADAASAQFTRNPEALANALRFTYLAHASGCRTFNVWRDDISHMLFVSGKDTVFETHPPVKERIRRLSPFGGEAANETVRSRVRAIAEQRRARAKAVSENIAKGVARSRALKSTDASIADARIQPAAIAAVRDPAKAGETLIDLLRGRTPECWQGALSPSERRTLALRCVNTIRDRATVSQRRFWADEAERAVLADGEYDSFELMVTAAVRRRLLSDSRMPKVVPARKLLPVVARVIATVASLGDDPDGGYRSAERKLSLFGSGLPPMPEPYDNAPDILAALEALVSLPPLAKREVLMGLRETVAQDGKVAEEEVDYLAAVADAIGAYGWMQIQTRAVEPKWSNLV